MGVLNVTPDSFSDGGRFATPDEAVRRGLEMADQGADIIDVGGESTRPGAATVDEDEEWRRIHQVIAELAGRELALSVDTTKAGVARRALEYGASLVNDISGGTMDPGLLPTVARGGGGLALGHIRGTPRTMQVNPFYRDLMGEVSGFLAGRAEAAISAGVDRESIVLDPGLGFGKRPEDNLEIIRRLGELRAPGFPLMVGASRKSFIGHVSGLPVGERLEGSLAAAVAASLMGADMVRVHDVRETVRALSVADAIRCGSAER
jgi:dihydropteroate synthase